MGVTFWPIVVVGSFFLWIVFAAVALEVPTSLAKWYKEPGNSVRAMTWVGSLFIVLITLTSDPDSFLGSLRTDSVTVAVTVIVIEELGRYRTDLEEKERIIRQMASHSNEFALDAVRLIRENNWHKDSSLCSKAFRNANLQGADLLGANLQGAELVGANLQEVVLSEANLEGANLRAAKLQNANLTWANLSMANLEYTDLSGADLMYANLEGAILTDANMQGASLVNADFSGADLGGLLVGVNLQNAILDGAILMDAILDRADWQGATCTLATVWPKGFDYKAVGITLCKGEMGFAAKDDNYNESMCL